MTMNFLDETQAMWLETVNRFMDDEVTVDYIRKCDMNRDYPYEAYAKIAAQGWLGLLFSEEEGGAGGDIFDYTLMAEGLVLPYLDIPFQHAHPDTLKRMARPAAAERTLDRIAEWRAICPDLALRSTFIVGYPGETEAEFQTLLDWLEAAQLDRVGAFKYEDVPGARSNALPDHVPEPVKQERWERFMERAQAISEARLAAKVGQVLPVIVDEVGPEGAVCRTRADAPEIDGLLHLDAGFEGLQAGDIVHARVEASDAYDLWGSRA